MNPARKPLIVGNWKMYLDVDQAVGLSREVARRVARFRHCDVVVCPAHPLLGAVAKTLEGTSVFLGAQDLSAEVEGAFTGESSARMLVSVGCRYVIVGHSERREYHLETDEMVRRKLGRALDAGLTPIVCVGEKLSERKAGDTLRRIGHQMAVALEGVSVSQLQNVVIAYEPVWAIGTGLTASAGQAEEVHEFIRNVVRDAKGEAAADSLRILYGGSVKPENIRSLMAERDVDGALVGGASLKADSFVGIVDFVG